MARKRIKRIPNAHTFLNEIETAFYKEVCKHLRENSALENVDAYQLTQLAHSWGLYHQAVEILRDSPHELVQTFESGASNVGPYYSIMERERAYFDKIAKNFGLNQKAREALLCFKVDANEPGGIISKLTAIREKSKKAV